MTTGTAPTDIKLRRKTAVVTLSYADGTSYDLSAEFLRVYSPSAEVRGHGKGQEVLQVGKRSVQIQNVEPVGHYAVKFVFSDGHESGIYSWGYLEELCTHYEQYWQEYLDRLKSAGASRDPVADSLSDQVQVINIMPLTPPKE
ncbi:MAG: DUF971 domain-containing protein [Pseudohongiellaceae bacterium]|nr:DUF971 domain-containing protein [Pseudohongiellaceae bacterium]